MQNQGEIDFVRGRWGLYEDAGRSAPAGFPRLWFHAASAGEATGAIPILHAIRKRLPDAGLILTSGTAAGYRFARAEAPEGVAVFPFPLDFPHVLNRAFRHFRPDLYVALESEFWPNHFQRLTGERIPAVLLNGRLTEGSARGYKPLRRLFQPIFAYFSALAMLSEDDRRRIISLGASPMRTVVAGNSKYDMLLLRVHPEHIDAWKDKLALGSNHPVVVGGSLRGSECIHLLEAFLAVRENNAGAIGLFAPRHLHRISEMSRWLNEHGVDHQLLSHLEARSERRSAPVVLVDRMGVLFDLYALGDLIFCGGTLEPLGGHNILEPTAWEKPVFYGPHLQNVAAEHKILSAAGGSFAVENVQDLIRQWSRWSEHLLELASHGRRARQALHQLAGATDRHVDLILGVLQREGRPASSRPHAYP